jgi:hypothetical protein
MLKVKKTKVLPIKISNLVSTITNKTSKGKQFMKPIKFSSLKQLSHQNTKTVNISNVIR